MVRWPGLAVMARPGLAYAYAAAGDLRARARSPRRRRPRRLLDRRPRLGVAALGRHAGLRRRAHLAPTTWPRRCTRRSCRSEPATPSTASAATTWAASSGRWGCWRRSTATPSLAAEHFDAALRQHRQTGERLLVAGTLRDAARALGDAGDAQRGAARSTPRSGSTCVRGRRRPRRARRRAPSRQRLPTRRRRVAGRARRHQHRLMRDTKGMRDLARLLAQPGTEVHVLDLVADGPTRAIRRARRPHRRPRPATSTGPGSSRSKRDLADADEHADMARSERLHAERDALIAELSERLRARRPGPPAQRLHRAGPLRRHPAHPRRDHPHRGRRPGPRRPPPARRPDRDVLRVRPGTPHDVGAVSRVVRRSSHRKTTSHATSGRSQRPLSRTRRWT